jgi:hypothetical protein
MSNPPTTAIDHDGIFKQLLSEFFIEFVELFFPDVLAVMDRDSITFLDKEFFQEIADSDRREADLVVQARVRDQQAYFIIHLEHQAQDRPGFDRRMFRYFARLYDQHDLPIYPSALLSYDTPRRPAVSRHQVAFAGLTVLDFHYQVVQLNRLDWQLYLRHPNPLASALLAKMHIPRRERVSAKRECLYTLAGMRLERRRTTMLAAFIDTYLTLNPVEQQQLQTEIAALRPQERRAVMELVTSWHIEGRAEEALMLVNRQLARKLGPLPTDVQERLAALPVEQLEALAEALLDFTALDDLMAWLDAHPIVPTTPGVMEQQAR